jgi:recombination protein RecA
MANKRGRPRKNKEIPLSEESKKFVEKGLQEAKEGKLESNPLVEKNNNQISQERKEKLNSVLRDINKNIDGANINYANTIEVRGRISFKHKCLNDLTGGGVVKGLHTCIWGSKSSGKTTEVLDLIATAQKLGNICHYINGEHSYDPIYAKKRGIDTESLIIHDVEKLEDGLDIVIKLCRENVADLIIFDSIHGLAPKAELYAGKGEKEKSTADSNIALRARALTQYFEMGMAFISKAKCAVVLIAQTRMDLGGFIKLETLTGGHALLHNCRLIIKFRRGQKADAPVEKRPTGKLTEKGKPEIELIQVGFDLVAHVDKSQIEGCTEGQEIHVPFYYKEGIQEN